MNDAVTMLAEVAKALSASGFGCVVVPAAPRAEAPRGPLEPARQPHAGVEPVTAPSAPVAPSVAVGEPEPEPESDREPYDGFEPVRPPVRLPESELDVEAAKRNAMRTLTGSGSVPVGRVPLPEDPDHPAYFFAPPPGSQQP